MVFCVHFDSAFGGLVPPQSWAARLLHVAAVLGHYGVDIFFIISGYLIYGAVMQNTRLRYTRFLRRRVRRIYPTFLVVLGLYLLVSVLLPQRSKVPNTAIAAALFVGANVLLLPGITSVQPIISVAWSLSYEFCFYAAIPVVVTVFGFCRLGRRGRVTVFLTLGAAFIGLCGLSASPERPLHMVGSPTHLRMMFFVVGILVYELRNDRAESKASTLRDALASGLVLVVLSIAYWLREGVGLPEAAGLKQYPGIYEFLVLGIGFGSFAFRVVTTDAILAKVLSVRPLRWLGNMSYSYYLIHGLTINAVALGVSVLTNKPAGHAGYLLLFFMLCLMASVGVSFLLFGFVEGPFSLAQRGTEKLHSPGSNVSQTASIVSEVLPSLNATGNAQDSELLKDSAVDGGGGRF
jgi:peptidoglycan/LPS O-acetylase OafA/YrhL